MHLGSHWFVFDFTTPTDATGFDFDTRCKGSGSSSADTKLDLHFLAATLAAFRFPTDFIFNSNFVADREFFNRLVTSCIASTASTLALRFDLRRNPYI